ncbi:RNA polymerase recycling motor HelD [Lentilactobacillus sp. Marseille-Q4993]|uniref:RNA polymerase recycling motor HelD n=1 Tax=Lentilactobacillus sp. Marseille-Q4993 TaxID=3039492 RepID=UPI0024BCBF2A|nr:RNA polymerase recycling motor HelD [Lentilactobacillus sp. Marseille-Q4993]
MENSEQKKEQLRVDDVVTKLQGKIQSTQAEFDRAHSETKQVQQNYAANTSVNYFEVDDRIETSAELQQQRGLVSRLTENEAILKSQLSTFKELKKSPYFGRIDIQDDGDDDEKLYIGIASFQDLDGEFLIYDWRAPISSIYYNGTLGKVEYDTPMGPQTTNLKKKRQFQIVDGEIKNMFDTNETVGDEMLQDALGQQNDEYMQNIVSTIQHEQNDIIRDTRSDLMVVQGVAGSGKTSAILQRIAFLLYHSRNDLEADEIILFSPNKLFSHYISEVLPSLGERNMRQVTFDEFAANRFEGMHVQSLFERYEDESTATPENETIKNIKSTAKFMDEIKQYCEQLTPSELKFADITFNQEVFFSKTEIKNIFASFPRAMATADKFKKTKNELIKQLKARIADETKQDWVNEEIDQLSDERYHDLLEGKKLGDFQDEEAERFYIAKVIVTKRLTKVYDAIFNNLFLDPYLQYKDFLSQYEVETENQQAWNDSLHSFMLSIEYHTIPFEDIAPLLYLRDTICGGGQNLAMKHLFVDEMQDYSIAQMKYLRYAFPNTKWTLLGDSEQALFDKVQSPATLLGKLNDAFHTRHSRLISLLRSYRSTYQITSLAKSILPNGSEIEAFKRDGEKPELLVCNSQSDAINQLAHKASNLENQFGTIAILTKNQAEADLLGEKLHSKLQITQLKNADRTLPKGIILMPIYLAKGLEFDAVIGWNISANNYPNEETVGTLYTMFTRAMHQLVLISIEEPPACIINNHEALEQLRIEHVVSNDKND